MLNLVSQDNMDRLGRVGIMLDLQNLCTPPAKEKMIVGWAYDRSLHDKLARLPFGLAE